MNRFDYLEHLDRLLTSLPYTERREVMYDYEEHFKEGLNDGKTEEEIIASLGAPEKIAAQYVTAVVPVSLNANITSPISPEVRKAIIAHQRPKKTGNNIGEILAISLMMLFINSILIGFYLAIWGVLISLVAVGTVLVVLGFALLISAIIATPVAFITLPAVLFQYPVLLFIGAVMCISAGTLILIGMFYIIKFTCVLSVRYIKWTIKLIRGF